MTSGQRTSAQAWSAALHASEQRLRGLVSDMHKDWLASWGGGVWTHQRLTNAWRDLASAFSVDSPPFSELADPMLRIALLPPEEVYRVLVIRALLPRLAQVRTCIDPLQRSKLISAVGNPALQVLVSEGREVLTSMADKGLPNVSELAWEGYQLFAKDGRWQDKEGLARLLRLRFPREGAPLYAQVSDPSASRWVLERLPLFVKEQPWWYDSTGTMFTLTWN